MGKRLDFQSVLQSIIGVRPDGGRNVYFQPPSTVKMNYPCIVYNLDRVNTKRANNQLYGFKNGYLVTVIDRDPDSEILEKILKLPMCSFQRHFTASDLNHNVYIIYY
jgi:hypothetical protein